MERKFIDFDNDPNICQKNATNAETKKMRLMTSSHPKNCNVNFLKQQKKRKLYSETHNMCDNNHRL